MEKQVKKQSLFINFVIFFIFFILINNTFSKQTVLINGRLNPQLKTDGSSNNKNPIESIDSTILRFEILYRNWKSISRNCRIFLNQASAHQHTALTEDFNERLAIYKKIFPGIAIDTKLLLDGIAVEKFLIHKLEIAPSSFEIEAVYNDFVKDYPYTPPPRQDFLSPVLRGIALFSTDTVIAMVSKMRSTKRNQRQKKYAELNKPWSSDKVKLNKDPTHCLVTNRNGNGECVVSVGEFNTFAAISPIPHAIRLDTARSMVLRKLLIGRLYVNLVNKDNVILKKELIDKSEGTLSRKLLLQNLPEKQYSEHLFTETYDKYFNRFFCDKQDKLVGIIGSTDSFYIDSLFHCIFDNKLVDTLKPSKRHVVLNLIPWIKISSQQLPDTLSSTIFSLRSQHYKKCATPFGFFLIRIIENKRKHKIFLEDARDALTYLIHEDSLRSRGKPDSIRALEYFNKYNEKFITPDTLLLKTWLVPSLIDRNDFITADSATQLEIIAKDTSTFKAQLIKSTELPLAISNKLLECYNTANDKDALVGPLFSNLGIWYFYVQEVIAGGKSISFASIKDSLMRKLEVQNLPLDKIAQTETGRRLLKQEVLASAYRSNIPIEIQTIPDAEIERLIKNKTVKISYKSNGEIDKKQLDIARQELFKNILNNDKKNIANWLETLSIDYQLLFDGCF
jgi:hypothetical protein